MQSATHRVRIQTKDRPRGWVSNVHASTRPKTSATLAMGGWEMLLMDEQGSSSRQFHCEWYEDRFSRLADALDNTNGSLEGVRPERYSRSNKREWHKVQGRLRRQVRASNPRDGLGEVSPVTILVWRRRGRRRVSLCFSHRLKERTTHQAPWCKREGQSSRRGGSGSAY